VSIASATSNNTTLYGNYTVEWDDFNIFTCVAPQTFNLSTFACVSPSYTQVNDIDCLVQTAFNFDETTCQSTSTAVMYTSSAAITTQQITTTTSASTTTKVNEDKNFSYNILIYVKE
jgi:hypothetical protein